jgi:hypothetical protein
MNKIESEEEAWDDRAYEISAKRKEDTKSSIRED